MEDRILIQKVLSGDAEAERQLYEAALDRMAREIAAVNKLSETEAVRLIETNLNKGPKRGKSADDDGANDGEKQEAAA